MKLLKILIIFSYSIIFQLQAQTPAKSLSIGNKFIYKTTYSTGGHSITVQQVLRDTIIKGTEYAVLSGNRYQRADSLRVYEYYSYLGSERLIYDLSWTVGDTVLNNYMVQSNSISSILDTNTIGILLRGLPLIQNQDSESYHQIFGLSHRTIYDGFGATTKQLEAAIINNKLYGDTTILINQPPVITSSQPSDTIIFLNGYHEYLIRASDPDFDLVSYSFVDAPAWLILDPPTYGPFCTLYGTAIDTGSFRIEIMVSDGRGGIDTQIYRLHVYENLGPPQIISIPDTFSLANSVYEYQIIAKSNIPFGFNYYLISHPSWLTKSDSGLLSGTPTSNDIGRHYVRVDVMNKILWTGEAIQEFYLNIVDTLEIISSPDSIVIIKSEYKYQIEVNNDFLDELEYHLIDSPNWILVSNSGLISGIPNVDDIGKHFMKILVDNSLFSTGSAIQEYYLNVFDTPQIIFSSDSIAIINSEYKYQIEINNSTSLNFQYQLIESPNWISISNSGLIFGTPSISDTGICIIKIKVFNERYWIDGIIHEYSLSVVESDNIINRLFLHQNYPNPFNNSTNFEILIPNEGFLNFKIIDIYGRIIYDRKINNTSAKLYKIQWNGLSNTGRQVASGIYFYRTIFTNQCGQKNIQTRKMMLLR